MLPYKARSNRLCSVSRGRWCQRHILRPPCLKGISTAATARIFWLTTYLTVPPPIPSRFLPTQTTTGGAPLPQNSNRAFIIFDCGIRFEDNLTFIHRPPPTMPLPESFTTAPSSPLLQPPVQPHDTTTSLTDLSLPPVSRPSLIPKIQYPRMTDQTIQSMRDLCHSDPAKWTCTKLAARFDCSLGFVSRVAGLKSSDGRNKSGM